MISNRLPVVSPSKDLKHHLGRSRSPGTPASSHPRNDPTRCQLVGMGENYPCFLVDEFIDEAIGTRFFLCSEIDPTITTESNHLMSAPRWSCGSFPPPPAVSMWYPRSLRAVPMWWAQCFGSCPHPRSHQISPWRQVTCCPNKPETQGPIAPIALYIIYNYNVYIYIYTSV